MATQVLSEPSATTTPISHLTHDQWIEAESSIAKVAAINDLLSHAFRHMDEIAPNTIPNACWAISDELERLQGSLNMMSAAKQAAPAKSGP